MTNVLATNNVVVLKRAAGDDDTSFCACSLQLLYRLLTWLVSRSFLLAQFWMRENNERTSFK
jgi:hypothetical protein